MIKKRVAIYIRLSNADEGTGHTKGESNSIRNQRSLIHRYLDGHKELSDYPRTEFVDDGFTGTNMNRPAFQRMIADIRAGGYCCCITKDFSRFARDYIEMGDYLECLFPFLGVRYISINDGYDSLDYRGTTGGLDVVMRAIIYDAYSKDLSIKSKTGRVQGRKKGRRVCGLPGYGYKQDPQRKAMDLIDPEAAAVVRRIFESAIGGMSVGEIAAMLNREGIPTPGMYFRQKNPEKRKFLSTSKKQRWNYGIVYVILKRYAYTGAAVGGIREQVAPCKRLSVKKGRADWIVVPDMHEAIITPEEYELAQKAIGERNIVPASAPVFPLKSLVVCGNCLRRMEKQKQTKKFRCKYGDSEGDEGCRGIHTPKEAELEGIIFRGIQEFIKAAQQKSNKKERQLCELRKTAASRHSDIEKLTRRIEFLKRSKFHEYERYTSGKISKEKYLERKREVDAETSRLQAEIEIAQERNESTMTECHVVHTELDDVCKVFREEKSLTYDMAHAFVDRILVYPNERIEIQWRFHRCLTEDE